MRLRDQVRGQKLADALTLYDSTTRTLVGIQTPEAFSTLIEQLLESIHRTKYVPALKERTLSNQNTIPNSTVFDPVKAAIAHSSNGNLDEAFWLVFLLTHFGRNFKAGWWYVEQIYGCLGSSPCWTWTNTSNDPTGFCHWLHQHQSGLKPNNTPYGFGNHRKYESLDAHSSGGTGSVVKSYINWVGPSKNHNDLIQNAYQQAGNDPKAIFDYLYHSMDAIVRFGRTARFDYLTMIGHIGLANIEPGSPYLKGATGPKKGALLLFTGSTNTKLEIAKLEAWTIELSDALGVGMQVIEDALCNWQKSPDKLIKFRG